MSRHAFVVPPVLRGGRRAAVAWTLLGYGVLAVGITVQVQASAGLAPWDALHQGLAELLGVSFGVAVVIAGVGALVVAMALGFRPLLGTLANGVLVGLAIDGLLRVAPDAADAPLAVRLALLAVGVAISGLGFAIYVAAGLGPGPRDGLVLVVARRTGVRIGITRNVIEALVLLVGVALGGQAGLGTVIAVLGGGPASEAGFRLLVAVRLARVVEDATAGSRPLPAPAP